MYCTVIHIFSKLFLCIIVLIFRLDGMHYLEDISVNSGIILKWLLKKRRSRVSVFAAATRLRLNYLTNRSAILDRGKKFFSSPKCPARLWGLTNLPLSEHPGFFPGCKGLKREADCSPQSSAEVKKEWSSNSVPSYAFLASTRSSV